jgi:hypothetical protein
MLQRFIIHFSLILLFAFTQMGVATHEISHLNEDTQQNQQDQGNHESQCEQCLVYSHAATADVGYSLAFDVPPADQFFVAEALISSVSTSPSSYSARAPPFYSQV